MKWCPVGLCPRCPVSQCFPHQSQLVLATFFCPPLKWRFSNSCPCVFSQRAANMIPAHDSPLAALAFDASGTKMATASEKVRHSLYSALTR